MVCTVEILKNDTGMALGIKACGVFELKREKVVSSEGVEIPDGEQTK